MLRVRTCFKSWGAAPNFDPPQIFTGSGGPSEAFSSPLQVLTRPEVYPKSGLKFGAAV